MTGVKSSFADRVRRLRESQMLSKTALARKLGVTTTCVWNWEEGNTKPRSESLRALSQALNAPMGYLESGTDWEGSPKSGSVAEDSMVGLRLAEVIAEAKARIANAAGIAPEKINISLDY